MTDVEINKLLNKYFENYSLKEQRVTLFMTTYKRPQYLKLAIESVLSQTYQNFYLIVLDNMSQDNTQDVVSEFNDERIIYIERESTKEMSNYSFSFNTCKTKYLIVLHDDDILNNRYLERVVEEMDKHDDYSALSVGAHYIDSFGNALDGCSYKEPRIEYSGMEYCKTFLGMKIVNQIVFPSAIYRRDFYGDSFNFVCPAAGPASDQIIWFQTERFGGKICILGEDLFRYRIHNNQDSKRNAGKMEIILLNYLFGNDFYHDIIMQNKYCISGYLKNVFKSAVVAYNQKAQKRKQVKEIVRLVNKDYLFSCKSKFWFGMLRFFSIFPQPLAFFANIIRKIKKKNHKVNG